MAFSIHFIDWQKVDKRLIGNWLIYVHVHTGVSLNMVRQASRN